MNDLLGARRHKDGYPYVAIYGYPYVAMTSNYGGGEVPPQLRIAS